MELQYFLKKFYKHKLMVQWTLPQCACKPVKPN